jgi:putrescine transport system permease protein
MVIAIPYVWLLIFFLIPFLIVLKISFAEFLPMGRPPYAPVFTWVEEGAIQVKMWVTSFAFLLSEPLYVSSYVYSLKVALVSTICCLLLGYPMAYAIARSTPTMRNLFLMLVILPFWTSFLLRVYAWIGLLNNNGVINNLLLALGIIDQPIVMMKTDFAVYVGIVYSYLPFMILPLYATLEKLDVTLLEAAADLGCRPLKAFLTITLPLSTPGIVAGFSLVFIPALGEFVIPDLLGGTDTLMIGKVLWDEFFSNRAWPVASAVAIAMLSLVILIMLVQRWLERRAAALA